MKKLINHPEAFVDETIEGILHGGDAPQAAATAWAGEDIEIEHAAQGLASRSRAWTSGGRAAVADDVRAPARVRGENAVIHDQVDRGAGDDRRELLHELDWLEK